MRLMSKLVGLKYTLPLTFYVHSNNQTPSVFKVRIIMIIHILTI